LNETQYIGRGHRKEVQCTIVLTLSLVHCKLLQLVDLNF